VSVHYCTVRRLQCALLEPDTIVSYDAGPPPGGEDAKEAADIRNAEEKFAIVIEGLKSGNIAETCRNRWGEKRSRAARCGAGEAHQAVGAGARSIPSADRDLKKRTGRVSCGQSHSSGREFMATKAS
jgi:hypothetical protein